MQPSRSTGLSAYALLTALNEADAPVCAAFERTLSTGLKLIAWFFPQQGQVLDRFV